MTWRSSIWLLFAFVLLAALALLVWRSKRSASDGRSFLRLVPTEGRWFIRSGPSVFHRRPWLFFVAGFLSMLALAGPQWGQSSRQLLRPSTDVIIALDLSRSMTASDVTPSRLDRAKLLIRTFLQEAAGQRIGLLVFSSSAQLAVPLTTDYQALEELLDELTPASLPEAGTDFTALLDESCDAFSLSDAAHRILLILSDGEDHGSGWKERLSRLVQIGVRVYAIGLGTDRGGLIPDPRGGFLKDEGGHPVLSRLQPDTLRAVVAATGGQYFRGDRWVTLAEILGFDATPETSRLEQTVGRTERFVYFLLPAVLCWCASFLWELPAFRSPPRTGSTGRPVAPSAKMPLAFLLVLGGLLAFPCSSRANSSPTTAAGGGEREALVRCVQALAGKDRPTASDYGALARGTISWCRVAQGEGLSAVVIQDGLSAVDQGEWLDPRLLPWAQMRKELQEFLKAAHPPDSGSEGASSAFGKPGSSSSRAPRFRSSAGGRPMRSGSVDRQGSPPGEAAEKNQAPAPASSTDRSVAKDRNASQSVQPLSEGQNGARARLHQVERLDRPALLFERMRQKETEQADAPPEPMDW